ncbi:MAG: hypothetical protein ACKOEP_01585 [Phycisphaerales bacterium]
MLNRTLPVAAASALALSGAASAGIISFNDASLFALFATNNGKSVATETFSSYSGFYASPLSGNFVDAPGYSWTATATNGLYADAGLMSTNLVGPVTFTFNQGVHGVGGQFFATDINFNVQPTFLEITLSDGSGFRGSINSATAFTGFYSTGALITSISFSVDSGEFPTADTLSIVVPAPGAVALLGAAGLVGRRRRR